MNEAVGRARDYNYTNMEEEKELKQVSEFVKANLVVITEANNKRRCVDGRYSSSEAEQAVVAVPGGDSGEWMAALGALNRLEQNLDLAKIEQSVVEAVGGVENFNFHTDEHAEHDHTGAGMGCGHLRLARTNPDDYGVTKEQMEFLFGELEHLADTGAHETVLHGEHGEQMVLVIDSDKYSVNSKQINADGTETQAFIYHQSLDLELMHTLAENLHKLILASGHEVDLNKIYDELVEVSALQRKQTLSKLSANLPRYKVEFDEQGDPLISKL